MSNNSFFLWKDSTRQQRLSSSSFQGVVCVWCRLTPTSSVHSVSHSSSISASAETLQRQRFCKQTCEANVIQEQTAPAATALRGLAEVQQGTVTHRGHGAGGDITRFWPPVLWLSHRSGYAFIDHASIYRAPQQYRLKEVGICACTWGYRGYYCVNQKSLVNAILQINDVCFGLSKLTVMPGMPDAHMHVLQEWKSLEWVD